MELYKDTTAWMAIGNIKKQEKRQSGKKKQRMQIRYARYFEESNGQGENARNNRKTNLNKPAST